MVIEVLIAERDPEHPLAQQGHHLMLDQMLTPLVVKAGSKLLRQLERMIRRPQKQCSGIRGDRAAVECCHHVASFNGCKSKQICDTFCRHRGALRIARKSLLHNNFFADSVPRCT